MFKSNKLGQHLQKNWQRYLMISPAVIAVFFFGYLPLTGLVMAFQRQNFGKGIFNGEWIGFKNFEFLFRTTDAWVITRNTVLYNVVFIILGLFLSVSLALIMNELRWKRYAKTLQTIYIMPYFLSMVVVGTITFAFLKAENGFVNSLFGIKVQWYQEKKIWPFLLTFIKMYCIVGFDSIIYMAVISGISSEYYESACLDGATKWQQIRHITLPQLRPIICINLIRAVGGMFYSDFGLFYNVPQNTGALFSVTDTLDTYIYRGLASLNNAGMSTAAGLYQSVVGLILVLVANKIISKIYPDGAMF